MVDNKRSEKVAAARRKLHEFQKKKHGGSSTLPPASEEVPEAAAMPLALSTGQASPVVHQQGSYSVNDFESIVHHNHDHDHNHDQGLSMPTTSDPISASTHLPATQTSDSPVTEDAATHHTLYDPNTLIAMKNKEDGLSLTGADDGHSASLSNEAPLGDIHLSTHGSASATLRSAVLPPLMQSASGASHNLVSSSQYGSVDLAGYSSGANATAIISQLTADKVELHSTIDRLSDAIQRLSSDNADMQSDISRLTLELNERFHAQQSNPDDRDILTMKLEESQAETRKVVDQLRSSSVEMDARTAEVALLKGTIGRLENSLQNMEKWAAEREAQLRDLKTVEVGMSREQAQSLELAVSKKDESIAQLQDQLDKEQSAHLKLQTQEMDVRALLEAKCAELLETQQLVESVTSQLHIQKTEKESLLAKLQDEAESRVLAQTSLETLLTEKSRQIEAMANMEQRHTAEEDRYAKLDSQMKVVTARMQLLQDDNKGLIGQLEELRNRNISLTNEKLQLVESLDVQSRKASEATMSMETLQETLNHYKHTLPSTITSSDKGLDTTLLSTADELTTLTVDSDKNPNPDLESTVVPPVAHHTSSDLVTNIPPVLTASLSVQTEESILSGTATPSNTPFVRSELVTDLQEKLQQLEEQHQRVSEALRKEQRLTTLLSAEVDALPDFIQIYHQERKQLINQMQSIVTHLKNEGTTDSPVSVGTGTNKAPLSLPVIPEATDKAASLANAYLGISHGAVSGILLHNQVRSFTSGCRRCKEWPLITL